jgi:type IV pilus assembly protein PilN
LLVEINLLPKKDPSSKKTYVILGILFVLLLALAAFVYWQYQSKQTKLEVTENQLSMTSELISAEQKQLVEYENSNSYQELQTAIKWAEEQPFDTVYLLNQLTRILPDRGYFTDFEMDEEYTIKQMIQFDTKDEAAYYLQSLLNYEWVEEAVVVEAKTTDILKEDADTTEIVKAAIDMLNKADIAPRYYAQYEIILDIPKLKESSKAAKKKEEEKQTSDDNNGDNEGGDTP